MTENEDFEFTFKPEEELPDINDREPVDIFFNSAQALSEVDAPAVQYDSVPDTTDEDRRVAAIQLTLGLANNSGLKYTHVELINAASDVETWLRTGRAPTPQDRPLDAPLGDDDATQG